MADHAIQETFRSRDSAFAARSTTSHPSPPNVISRTALKNIVEGAALDLPPDYGYRELDLTYLQTNLVGVDILFSYRETSKLRQIGAQLLTFNQEGMIQPPLTPSERESIEYLIEQADQIEAVQQALA
jgi:hypothetical protein